MIDNPGQVLPTNNSIRFGVIGDAWRYFRAQPAVWLGAAAIYALIVVVSYAIDYFLSGADNDRYLRFDVPHLLLLDIVLDVMSRIPSAGLFRIALRQIDGHTISVGDMFKIGDIAGPLTLASLIIAVPATIALELFFLPTFLVEAIFMFTLAAIVDKRLDALAAIKLSWNTLKRHIILATVWDFVMMLVFMSGALVCGVGVLVTGSLYFLAVSRLYRDFFPLPGAQPQPTPPDGGFYPPIPEVPQ